MHKSLTTALLALSLAALAATPQTVILDVKNMDCELCSIAVKKSLEKASGVAAVKVDFDKKTATITYDGDQAQPERLTQATINAGFPSTVHR